MTRKRDPLSYFPVAERCTGCGGQICDAVIGDGNLDFHVACYSLPARTNCESCGHELPRTSSLVSKRVLLALRGDQSRTFPVDGKIMTVRVTSEVTSVTVGAIRIYQREPAGVIYLAPYETPITPQTLVKVVGDGAVMFDVSG